MYISYGDTFFNAYHKDRYMPNHIRAFMHAAGGPHQARHRLAARLRRQAHLHFIFGQFIVQHPFPSIRAAVPRRHSRAQCP